MKYERYTPEEKNKNSDYDESSSIFFKSILAPTIAIFYIIKNNFSFGENIIGIGLFLLFVPFLMAIRELFYNEKLFLSLYIDCLKNKLWNSHGLMKLSFIILAGSQISGLIMIIIYFIKYNF